MVCTVCVTLWWLAYQYIFSPPCLPAKWTMYCAAIFLLFFNCPLGDQLSLMYCTDFHHIFRIGRHGCRWMIWPFSSHSRDIATATSFGAKLAKFAYPTFIHRTGILKWIARSQCQCEKIKWHWVRTDPGKSWNYNVEISRPGKSWKKA